MPSRQTTRCGTDRIGMSVQIVRCPVRKFARVGRPCRRSASSARTSGSVSVGRAVAAPRATTSSSIRSSSARCQASRRVVVGERVDRVGERRRPRRRSSPRVPSASSAAPRRSMSSAKRPARSIAPLSTSSSGRTPSKSRCSLLGHRDADEHAVQPARQVPAAQHVELERRAVLGVEPPADAALGDPALDPREVVVVEVEAAADRLAVDEVEHLRRRDPLPRQLDQPRDDAEHRVRLAQRAVGEPHAQVGRADVVGQRVASSSSAVTSPAPNVAWMSGANVSMSGHMTMTSRGSSVGSSSSRCRIASRRTSTWRARPWQAWTCDAAVVRRRAAGARQPRRAAARRAARGRRGRRPGCGRAACRSRCSTGWWWSTCSAAAEHELHLARVAAPRRRAGGWRAASRSGRRSRRTIGAGGAPARSASHSPGDGCRRKRWTSRPAAIARRTCRCPAGRRVRPKSDSARREVERARARRAAARTRPSSALGESGHADPLAQPPPQLGLPARVVGRTPPAPSCPSRRPGADHLRAVQRVAVEQLGEVAQRARGAARGAPGRPSAGPPEVGGERREPRLAEVLLDDLEQRPDRALGRATGRRPASMPEAIATASPTSRRGDGKPTFAHTPSARPGDAPSRSDIRCESQRSMPRVGTATTSGANGSSGGSASRPRSASTRPSARSARWTCSIVVS